MKEFTYPKHIRYKADTLLKKYRNHEICPRKTYRRRYLTINVTPGWRLLSRDEGKTWQLLTHADYDKAL